MGPTPNLLILSYLEHCLASHLVTHVSLLTSVCKYDPSGSKKPHCTAVLLALLEKTCKESHLNCRVGGKNEECISLATSLMHLSSWLLKVISTSFETLIQTHGQRNHNKNIIIKNYKTAIRLLQTLIIDSEFASALFTLGKCEERDNFMKSIGGNCKVVLELSKSAQTFCPDEFAALKQDVVKITNSLKSMDPSGSLKDKGTDPYYVTSAIQPVLAFEAVLNPTSDLSSLASHLNTIALVHNLTFSDLIYETIRCMLISVSASPSENDEGVDIFEMGRLRSYSFPDFSRKDSEIND